MGNIDSIELSNDNGFKARFLSLGARWTEMHILDNEGVFEDVLLGFPQDHAYLKAEEKYYGAVVGRYCGRIPDGVFIDGGTKLELPLNPNTFSIPVIR